MQLRGAGSARGSGGIATVTTDRNVVSRRRSDSVSRKVSDSSDSIDCCYLVEVMRYEV